MYVLHALFDKYWITSDTATYDLLLPKLEFLSLASNGLTGTIPKFPFASMSLKSLHLHNNALEGEIPGNINLSFMEELLLHDNKLSGTFPINMTENDGASNLRKLTLFNNSLSGNVSDLCKLFLDGSLELLQVDMDEIPCECCSPGNYSILYDYLS